MAISATADTPLKPICDWWQRKIKESLRIKEVQFNREATECRRFFHSQYGEWLYSKQQRTGQLQSGTTADEDDGDIKPPSFRLTINKAAEVVQVFGPFLYQRNPDRRCKSREVFVPPIEFFGDPQDPNAQQMFLQVQQMANQEKVNDVTVAALMQSYLTYTPKECGLSNETHLAIDESLTIGLSCLWTEVTQSPDGTNSVGTFYDSADNFTMDHDARHPSQCLWVARLCCHPAWQLEREYGWEPGSLKKYVNYNHADDTITGRQYKLENQTVDTSSDNIWYWKIYSKLGIGHRLSGSNEARQEYLEFFDQIPDYCYLAIAPGMPCPLNLPPDILESADVNAIVDKVHWPTPFWLDNGKWPVALLEFHRIPNRLWPISHLTPALGELRFINWVYSMMTGKIRIVSRDFLVILKSTAETIKSTIQHGPDYSMIEVSELHGEIDKMVKFLQHPTFNPEIYAVVDRVMDMFDKRTGLSDLLYGASPVQLRSAQEAQIKQTNASVRPQEMAQVVEDLCSTVAQMEAACARWHLQPQDVKPVLGTVGAGLWQSLMLQTDPAAFFHQYEVSVEAGSGKRPNRETDAQNVTTALTNFTTIFFTYAQGTGDFGPINKLVADWAKANNFEAKGYMMHPPAPMAPPPGAPGPGPAPAALGAPGQPGQAGQPAPR